MLPTKLPWDWRFYYSMFSLTRHWGSVHSGHGSWGRVGGLGSERPASGNLYCREKGA